MYKACYWVQLIYVGLHSDFVLTVFFLLLLSLSVDKFWYCRLSPNHKVLHYGDLEESPQGEVPHDSLQEKRKCPCLPHTPSLCLHSINSLCPHHRALTSVMHCNVGLRRVMSVMSVCLCSRDGLAAM